MRIAEIEASRASDDRDAQAMGQLRAFPLQWAGRSRPVSLMCGRGEFDARRTTRSTDRNAKWLKQSLALNRDKAERDRANANDTRANDRWAVRADVPTRQHRGEAGSADPLPRVQYGRRRSYFLGPRLCYRLRPLLPQRMAPRQ